MSGLPKIKSGTQRNILARYAIIARKEAEQRARKGKKTLGPLHEELSAKLFKRPSKKYTEKNQPLKVKVEVIDPAKIFKKRIVKTIAPSYGEKKLDVLGSEQQQQKERIESQRKYQELLLRSLKGKSPLTVSQAAPGRTRRTPNLGGKKKRLRTRKKSKTQKNKKEEANAEKLRKKRKRRRRRSHKK